MYSALLNKRSPMFIISKKFKDFIFQKMTAFDVMNSHLDEKIPSITVLKAFTNNELPG